MSTHADTMMYESLPVPAREALSWFIASLEHTVVISEEIPDTYEEHAAMLIGFLRSGFGGSVLTKSNAFMA